MKSMKFKVFTMVVAALFLLFGCNAGTKTNQEGRGTTTNTTFEKTRSNNNNITRNTRDNRMNEGFMENVSDRNRHSNNRSSNNHQDRYDISEEAADRIVREIAEIDRAYVLTTGNNAYVAAVLDKQRTTGDDNLTHNDRQNSSAGMNVRNVNDRNVKDRTVNEGNANDRRSDNHMSNRRDTISNDTRDKRDLESDEVTDDVKNKIADIVQDVDNRIDNVYVSTSPDFVDLSSNYVRDMNDGKSVRGFFDQIGNTIERIFPQNKR